MKIRCAICNKFKNSTEFPIRDKKSGRRGSCFECYRKRRRELYPKHKAIIKETFSKKLLENRHNNLMSVKKRRDFLRFSIIKMYGNKCKCCGERNIAFLAIDHVQRNGAIERKDGIIRNYLEILNSEIDNEKYRILCHNCNWAYWTNKRCPHQNSLIRRFLDWVDRAGLSYWMKTPSSNKLSNPLLRRTNE